MDDFLAHDWGALLAGTGTVGLVVLGFRLVAWSSNFAVRTYKDAATYSGTRVDGLEAEIRAMRSTVTALEGNVEGERKKKHDWRSFSGSLYMERFTIRQFAEAHGCTEVVDLMNRLDELRNSNPLMDDLESMTEGDPDA